MAIANVSLYALEIEIFSSFAFCNIWFLTLSKWIEIVSGLKKLL